MGNPNLFQLFDEQGRQIPGKGATKQHAHEQGLLHGNSHVWIWRQTTKGPVVLVQRRAADKATWPNRLDISAAGHIDLGEQALTAALREVKEEIDLDVAPEALISIGVYRDYIFAPNGLIENEFQYLYLLEISGQHKFTIQAEEVESLQWKPLQVFKDEIAHNSETGLYVTHSPAYFDMLITALDRATKR